MKKYGSTTPSKAFHFRKLVGVKNQIKLEGLESASQQHIPLQMQLGESFIFLHQSLKNQFKVYFICSYKMTINNKVYSNLYLAKFIKIIKLFCHRT